MNKIFNLFHIALKVDFVTDENDGIVNKTWEVKKYKVIEDFESKDLTSSDITEQEETTGKKVYMAGGYKNGMPYRTYGAGAYVVNADSLNKVHTSVAGNMGYGFFDFIKVGKVDIDKIKKEIEKEVLNKILERHQYYLDFANCFRSSK